MIEKNEKLLDAFDVKFKHLLVLYENLQQENASLRGLLSEKEAELAEMKRGFEWKVQEFEKCSHLECQR